MVGSWRARQGSNLQPSAPEDWGRSQPGAAWSRCPLISLTVGQTPDRPRPPRTSPRCQSFVSLKPICREGRWLRNSPHSLAGRVSRMILKPTRQASHDSRPTRRAHPAKGFQRRARPSCRRSRRRSGEGRTRSTSRNVSIASAAVRLFASMNGWFIVRKNPYAAAFSGIVR